MRTSIRCCRLMHARVNVPSPHAWLDSLSLSLSVPITAAPAGCWLTRRCGCRQWPRPDASDGLAQLELCAQDPWPAARCPIHAGEPPLPLRQPLELGLPDWAWLHCSYLTNRLAPRAGAACTGYHGDVTQQNIRDTVDAIADQSRGFSLLDLGFSDVGVDDGWQACDAGVLVDNATTQCAPFCTSFHAADGTPLLNRSKFQDLKALVDYGHGKGTTMGWYNNNCMCGDEYAKRNNATWRQLCDEGDIKLLLSAGFDGVKIVSAIPL